MAAKNTGSSTTPSAQLLPKVWYKCPICSTACQSCQELKRHCKNQHGKFSTKWMTNRILPPTDTETQNDETHSPATPTPVKPTTSRGRFRCPKCSKRFVYPGNFKLHLKKLDCSSGPKLNFKCGFCQKSVCSWHKLEEHTRSRHTLERPFFCYMCSASFRQAGSRNYHLLAKHTMERPFPCKFCKKRYVVKNHLKVHMKEHTGENLFSCVRCSKTFITRQSLTLHLRTHSSVQEYHCDICSAGFNQSHHLKTHKANKHRVRDTPFSCLLCVTLAFETRKERDAHYKANHPNDKPFACETKKCGMKFASHTGLKTHITVSHGGGEATKFKCDHCSYSNHRKIRVAEHEERMHINPKNYICVVDGCGRQYSSAIGLISHRRTHANNDRYPCEVCGASWRCKKDYQRHVRSMHGAGRKNSKNDGKKVAKIKINHRPRKQKMKIGQKRKNPGQKPQIKIEEDATGVEFFTIVEEELEIKLELKEDLEMVIETPDGMEADELENKNPIPSPQPLQLNSRGLFQRRCVSGRKSYAEIPTGKPARLAVRNKNKKTEYRKGPSNSVCKQCGKSFTTKHSLHYHSQFGCKFNPGFGMRCAKCPGSLFGSKEFLLAHKLQAHPNPDKWVCGLCSLVLKSEQGLRSHTRNMHSTRDPVPCPHCEKTFKTEIIMRRHALVHGMERRWECHLCEQKCYRKDQLQSHLISHSSQKSISCTFCPMTFKRSSALKTHIQTHTGEKPWQCREVDCRAEFHSRAVLHNHIKRVHIGRENIPRPFSCDTCDSRFESKAYLALHKKTHNPVKKYGCDLCDFRTHLSGNLKIHKNGVHSSGLKTWECSVCHQKYKSKLSCRNHEKRHTMVKNWPCYFCGKRFFTRTESEIHLNSHTLEKPFQCLEPNCGKYFGHTTTLSTHKKIHTAIKTHICEKCGGAWFQKGNFNRHNCTRSKIRNSR